MGKEIVIPQFDFEGKTKQSVSFSLERIEADVGYDATSPHRHNFYEIFLFEKGGGLHMIDFVEWKIASYDVHLVSPGQVHFMQRAPKSSGYVLKFTADFLLSTGVQEQREQFLPNSFIAFNQSTITLPKTVFTNMMEMVHDIEVESNSTEWGSAEVIRNYINLILIRCGRMLQNANDTRQPVKDTIPLRFMSLLESQYKFQQRVSFYSDSLHVTDAKLNLSLKSAYGLSSSDMIAKRVLLEAKRFLLHSSLSIKEIAFTLGFEDNAYFNRWFKKFENDSPGVFRSNTREKYNSLK
ncbi:MAG: AraC family transcriptional activator of pobA [Bacteroidia bacterium]|jgi:AraC family transcriptional activator of pobA